MKLQDWKKIEDELRFPGATSKMLVDGRTVTLQVETLSMKLVIGVFVDGWSKGAWLIAKEPCPEQAYMRRVERNLWSKKERDNAAKYAKRFGKREAEKVFGGMNKKFVAFYSYFPSVRAVRIQYEKTFKSIELVTE